MAVMMMLLFVNSKMSEFSGLQISTQTDTSLKPDAKRSKPTPGYRESLFSILVECSETDLKAFYPGIALERLDILDVHPLIHLSECSVN
jgi:hypothetical protein